MSRPYRTFWTCTFQILAKSVGLVTIGLIVAPWKSDVLKSNIRTSDFRGATISR